jgi:NAD(P)-dependent dehydrogenase (short-subunit alcohol dehydrogenase family)
LVDSGLKVVIADVRGASVSAARLSGDGAEATGVDADVADARSVHELVGQIVATHGSIDVLVNNAGLFSSLKPGPFELISDEEWMQVMRVNTLGPFLCAKAVVPHMRRVGFGRIVNVASTTVHKGTPNLLHYVASKGAVVAFTRALARELGANGITVNAIAPGFTLSDGVLRHGLHTQVGNVVATRAIQRDQTPDDLVGALLYLVSDGAAFVTGQTLAVDGGSVFL